MGDSVIVTSQGPGERAEQEAHPLPPSAPLYRETLREVVIGRKTFALLRQIWRKLYKPTLDNLYRESASSRVRLTPDVALAEMEQVFQSVFQSVEAEGSSRTKRVPAPRPSLSFRFDRIAFRREAHHYAVNLFYKTYFSRKHESPRAASRFVGNNRGRTALRRGRSVLSQPRMIRTVLLEHGGPLHADKISEAIAKKFKVSLKRHDITSVIYRAIKEGRFFRKQGINTFGLVEWLPRRVV